MILDSVAKLRKLNRDDVTLRLAIIGLTRLITQDDEDYSAEEVKSYERKYDKERDEVLPLKPILITFNSDDSYSDRFSLDLINSLRATNHFDSYILSNSLHRTTPGPGNDENLFTYALSPCRSRR